jgi:hypothetical protein
MKTFLIILVFFCLTALLIISNNGLAMRDEGNFEEFKELYVGWLNKVYQNMQGITGQVIKLDWLPE